MFGNGVLLYPPADLISMPGCCLGRRSKTARRASPHGPAGTLRADWVRWTQGSQWWRMAIRQISDRWRMHWDFSGWCLNGKKTIENQWVFLWCFFSRKSGDSMWIYGDFEQGGLGCFSIWKGQGFSQRWWSTPCGTTMDGDESSILVGFVACIMNPITNSVIP